MKKRQKNVTIIDIAKELGVSTAMVSMVLSGKGPKHRISKKASNKVIEAAKRLGYNPNLLARSLRTGKTGVIGLIVADIANPFYAVIARMLENEAYNNGYDVMFASSDENLAKFKKLGNDFLTKQVDGLIITPVIDCEDIIHQWQANEVPIVSIDRYIPSLKIPYAVTDNFDASFQIIKFIIEKGYNKIAFLGKDSNLSTFIEREEGFIYGAEQLKLTQEQYNVFKLDHLNWQTEIRSTLKKILKEKYDIIFFSQNMIGIEGLRTLNHLKINIPNDIAVISFDDPEVFEFNRPAITCFKQPLKKLAKRSLYYFVSMVNNKFEVPITYEKFKGRLIIRNSC